MDRALHIGVIFVAAIDAQKLRLRLPIVFRNMAAARARPAGVVRRHRQQHAAVPGHLVGKLPSELAPPLVENGAVQARLLRYFRARLFYRALGRARHIAHLYILDADERAVLADRRRGFVQEVFAGIGDAGVNLLDAGLRLLPVVAEPDLAAHAALVTGQPSSLFPDTVARRDVARVAQGGESNNANIDADGTCRRR